MSDSFCPKCGGRLNTGGRCQSCGGLSVTYTTTNNDYTYNGYIYVEPDAEAKIIMQQQEKIEKLEKRIVCLQEKLRWRPLWKQPEKCGPYEVEFDYGSFHDVIFYNDISSSWSCNQKHVNITGWRPIPKLEAEDER